MAEKEGENLEEKIRPMFNPHPGGPNMKETEEVIKAVATVLTDDTWDEVKASAMETIARLKKGYEIQSGQRYTGYLPPNFPKA